MSENRYPSQKLDQYMLRLPDGMRDRIKAAAEANNRSMNAEIVATLEEKYPAPVIEYDPTDVRKMIEEMRSLLEQMKEIPMSDERFAILESRFELLDDLCSKSISEWWPL